MKKLTLLTLVLASYLGLASCNGGPTKPKFSHPDNHFKGTYTLVVKSKPSGAIIDSTTKNIEWLFTDYKFGMNNVNDNDSCLQQIGDYEILGDSILFDNTKFTKGENCDSSYLSSYLINGVFFMINHDSRIIMTRIDSLGKDVIDYEIDIDRQHNN